MTLTGNAAEHDIASSDPPHDATKTRPPNVRSRLPPQIRPQPPPRPGGGQNRVTELKVSGHLMTLDTGLFCVFQAPGSAAANDRSGLPGVRISLPPGPAGRPEAVSISTFRDDGWLDGGDAAALVRVAEGPAQVLVTVYQAPTAPPETRAAAAGDAAGRGDPGGVAGAGRARRRADAGGAPRTPMWWPMCSAPATCRAGSASGSARAAAGSGSRASAWRRATASRPTDIEYQAVLGRGWLSPWIEGGKFCGSRGMALPLLGLKVRLKGDRGEDA